ncbi:MAG: phage regulatory protein/antirepressor Ant [Agrobacterium cavarae]
MSALPEKTPVTMTSREIADLTGKEHKNVKRDIEKMLSDLQEDKLKFEHIYLDSMNREQIEFRLDRDLTETLLLGYSAVARLKVIRRLRELEGMVDGSNVTFIVPRSLPEALRLAADLADKVEEQKAVIGALEPKAEFHDAVTSAVNCQTVSEVAKILGSGQNRMFKYLREIGLLMDDNQPYQSALDAGYFKPVEGAYKDKRGEIHTYTRTLVTGKGFSYIQRRFRRAA